MQNLHYAFKDSKPSLQIDVRIECRLNSGCVNQRLLRTHSHEQSYLEGIRVFYLLLSIFLIVSLAVRVKKRGAILWIISAGTSSWSLIATFNAESICSKPVSSTSFRCSLHSLLNIFSPNLMLTELKRFRLRQSSIYNNCTFWRTKPTTPSAPLYG